MDLVISVYSETKDLPDNERFGLISQARRSALSIPSNIAEGCGRSSEMEFKRFLEIAIGSSFELESQLIVCERLGYLNSERVQLLISEINEIQKQINNLILKIRTNQ